MSIFQTALGITDKGDGALITATGTVGNVPNGLPIDTKPNPISSTGVLNPKPAILLDPKDPIISIGGLISKWTGTFLNPFVESFTSFLNNPSASSVNQKTIDKFNTLLMQLEALRIYFDFGAKVNSNALSTKIDIQKASSVEYVIKTLIRTFDTVTKSLNLKIERTDIPFDPTQVSNVYGMALNWKGAKLRGSYASYRMIAQRPVEDQNNSGNNDTVGTGGNTTTTADTIVQNPVSEPSKKSNVLMWLGLGIGGLWLLKKVG